MTTEGNKISYLFGACAMSGPSGAYLLSADVNLATLFLGLALVGAGTVGTIVAMGKGGETGAPMRAMPILGGLATSPALVYGVTWFMS